MLCGGYRLLGLIYVQFIVVEPAIDARLAESRSKEETCMHVSIVKTPETRSRNASYSNNKEPLSPLRLIKLPLGSIKTAGWIAHQLKLMVDGMTGRLEELSDFLDKKNGWFGGDEPGWEEQPYWFRGFYPLAVLTNDERCRKEAEKWIEAIINSQDEDGYFGARCYKDEKSPHGEVFCDLWPHMVMLDALIQHYEATGDERVPVLMKRFFEFCSRLPDESFLPRAPKGVKFSDYYGTWHPSIQASRAGDMLPHIYWLYNRSGDDFLLDLANRFYRGILEPTDEWLDDHIVHFTQRFSYFALFGRQTGVESGLAQSEYWYAQHMGTWGQQPRGIFAADERIRSGKTGPRQGFETCGMVEFAKSFYQLGRISGDTIYADRCEDIMLNHFPASQTPDLKGLHYLTASNQPQLDASGDHDYQNRGCQIAYSPHKYRCCQHNVAMGWPWYAQNLWQATPDNGLAAWLYGACEVTAKTGKNGDEVRIKEETAYPFDGKAAISITKAASDSFPLYFRVPGWCKGFTLNLNGKPVDVDAPSGTYVRLEHSWTTGDTVDIDMAMDISLTNWPRTGSVTVDRGPLSYSVRIEEQWQQFGGTDRWPELEVFPSSPWNYGLLIDKDDPASSFEVTNQPTPRAVRASDQSALAGKPAKPDTAADSQKQPWTVDAAPVEIKAKAKRIPDWKLDGQMVQELITGPIRSLEPEGIIRMIPLGCARLRISCLPVISEERHAREWKAT